MGASFCCSSTILGRDNTFLVLGVSHGVDLHTRNHFSTAGSGVITVHICSTSVQ